MSQSYKISGVSLLTLNAECQGMAAVGKKVPPWGIFNRIGGRKTLFNP
jgi:hypothetical protein